MTGLAADTHSEKPSIDLQEESLDGGEATNAHHGSQFLSPRPSEDPNGQYRPSVHVEHNADMFRSLELATIVEDRMSSASGSVGSSRVSRIDLKRAWKI